MYLSQNMRVSGDRLCDFVLRSQVRSSNFPTILVPAAVDSSTGLGSWRYIHAFGKLARLFEYLQLFFNMFLALLLVGRNMQNTNQLLPYDRGP